MYLMYLFDKKKIMLIYDGEPIILSQVTITSQKTTDISSYLTGRKKPNAIIFNPEDNAYFSQIYDKNSANWLIENIQVINKIN